MIEKGISLFEEGNNELSFNFESKDVRFSVDQLIKVTLDSNCYYNIKITRVTELSENVFKIKGIDVTPPFIKKMSNALRPEKTISVREWSDTYRYLDSSASSMPGKYSTELTPFLREPLESLTINNGVELVAFMKSAQIGASEAGNNFIGYIIDIAPASTMVVLPTADLAKQFSKERISPLVSATPRLKSKIKNDVRNSDNTVLMKKFEGGFIKLVGANSATNLRSTPIKFLFFDEVDAYPFDVDGEGSPIELALKRTTTFKRRKIFMASTPTVKHFSNIEEYFLRGDQRHFFLPCPHCQVAQHLEFKQLKYRVNANNKQIADADSVYYECKHCKEEIYESSKTKMMNMGQWIATNKDGDPKIRSYHINSLYSPLGWKSWLEIINEYLVAKEDQDKMKTFWNTTLGLPYTDETHKPDARKLEKRKSSWREWTCPDDVVYINAGVDTQDDRLAVVVVGYGKNNQHYIIGYEEIDGDPNQPDVWEKLKLIIDKPIMHDSGLEMFVKDVAVDSGGHRTAYVYDFCRADKEKYIPIKGRSFDGATSMKRSSIVDKDLVNKDTGDALYLYLVNNNYNKKLIYQYLGNESPGRNYFHFNHDLPSNFFDMLCSEELVVKFVKGQRKEEFTTGVKGMGARNEALDCVNYSFALARNNQIHRLVDEKKYAEYYDMNVTQKLKALEKMNNGEPVKPKLPPRPSKFNNAGGSRFSSNRR